MNFSQKLIRLWDSLKSEPIPFRKALKLSASWHFIFFILILLSLAISHRLNPVGIYQVFGSWDAGFYVRIAMDGYSSKIPEAYAIAFFPLYPLLIHFMSFFVHWPGVEEMTS